MTDRQQCCECGKYEDASDIPYYQEEMLHLQKRRVQSFEDVGVAQITATMRVAQAIYITMGLLIGTTLFCTWLLVGAWMTPIEDSDDGPVRYEKYRGALLSIRPPYTAIQSLPHFSI